MRVRLRNGYARAYAQIMQHTHTHKAVTGRVEAKSYSLVEGNQTIALIDVSKWKSECTFKKAKLQVLNLTHTHKSCCRDCWGTDAEELASQRIDHGAPSLHHHTLQDTCDLIFPP